jgi:hypothetical protein
MEGNDNILTLILLTSTKWWAPTSASKWQMGFNSAFKGLSKNTIAACLEVLRKIANILVDYTLFAQRQLIRASTENEPRTDLA